MRPMWRGVTLAVGVAPPGACAKPRLRGAIARPLRVAITWMDHTIPDDRAQHAEAAMLEDLLQALGRLTKIRNPFYDARSMLSHHSNAMTPPGVQDATALRRHFPER